MKKKILAIIPVKLNSKRLKKKNIKLLKGQELFLRTLKSAKKSKKIDDIIISTSSLVVLNKAKKIGHFQKYIRPKVLNKNNKTNTHVCLDVLKKIRGIEHKIPYDYTLLLQPTSPIKNSKTIDNFISSFIKSKKNFGITLKGPIFKKYNFLGTLKKNKFTNEKLKTKNKKFYSPNGAMYVSKTNSLLKEKKFLGKDIFGYVQSKFESIDIDTIEDFKHAEYVIEKKLFNLD